MLKIKKVKFSLKHCYNNIQLLPRFRENIVVQYIIISFKGIL